jgi:hypothetical protein
MCSRGRRGLRGIAGLRPPLRITYRSALHLHFELWRGGRKDTIDPEPLMKNWEHVPDPGDLPATLVVSK